jgi:hypothetical protein
MNREIVISEGDEAGGERKSSRRVGGGGGEGVGREYKREERKGIYGKGGGRE